ncbi:MAG: hypothetical protein KDA16_03725 [Phycisphaerales bacterium]|nr:hypothetical protein [Phycisphaerales bacterium]
MRCAARLASFAVVSLACAAQAGPVADAAVRLGQHLSGLRQPEPSDMQGMSWLAELPTSIPTNAAPSEALALAEQWGGAARRAGVEWRVMFAIPSDSDVQLARYIAKQTIAIAADAERRVEAAKAVSDDAQSEALADRALVVLPLDASRALLLYASCGSEESRKRALTEAAGELLLRPTDAGPWYETQRATLAALALSMSGNHEAARQVEESADRAARLIASANDRPSLRAERILIGAQVEAASGAPAAARSMIRAALDSDPFVINVKRDWYASTIAASMHALLAINEARAAADPATRQVVLAQALVPIEQLARSAASLEEASFALSAASDAIALDSQLAAASDFGFVAHSITSPETLADTDRLSRIIAGNTLNAHIRASAEIALMRALAESPDALDRLDAAGRAVSFAQQHADDNRAPGILAWGASLAASAPHAPDTDELVVRVLSESIKTSPRHSNADTWRSQLASALIRRAAGDSAEEFPRLVDEAVRVLDQRSDPDAASGEVLVWAGERIEDAGGVGRDYFDRALASTRALTTDEAARVRIRALVGLTRDAAAWTEAAQLLPDRLADAAPAACIALIRLNRADEAHPIAMALDREPASRLLARTDRLAWAETEPEIERFIEDARADPIRKKWPDKAWRLIAERDPPNPAHAAWGLLLAGEGNLAAMWFNRAIEQSEQSPALARGLAESILLTGDDAGAFAAFRYMAQLTETDKSSRDYWHAQARLAEILVRQNADGSRTDTIARLIRRLRTEPGLDQHPDCAARLDRVAKTVGVAQ